MTRLRSASQALAGLAFAAAWSLTACRGGPAPATWPGNLFGAVKDCPTYVAPWVDEETRRVRRFAGTVIVDELNFVPEATVFVRPAGSSDVVRTMTDAEGRFSMSLPRGRYDVLVCRDAFDAWQGGVVISPWAGRDELRLPLTVSY